MTLEQVRGRDRGGASNDTRYAIKNQSTPEIALTAREPVNAAGDARLDRAVRAQDFLVTVERKLAAATAPITDFVRPLIKITRLRKDYNLYRQMPLSTLTEKRMLDRFEYLHENWAACDPTSHVTKGAFRIAGALQAAGFTAVGVTAGLGMFGTEIGSTHFVGTFLPIGVGVAAALALTKVLSFGFGRHIKRAKAEWGARKAVIRAQPQAQSVSAILRLAAIESPDSKPGLDSIAERMSKMQEASAEKDRLIASLLLSGVGAQRQAQLKRVPVRPRAAQTLAAKKPGRPGPRR